MTEEIPLCERCPSVYVECKYQEQREQEDINSPWTCQGRVEAFRIAYPMMQDVFQKLKEAGLLKWVGKDRWDEHISGNSTNAFLTYLEEHAGTLIHYMPEGAESSKLIKHDFDPRWIFEKKIEWEKDLPLYKNKVQGLHPKVNKI